MFPSGQVWCWNHRSDKRRNSNNKNNMQELKYMYICLYLMVGAPLETSVALYAFFYALLPILICARSFATKMRVRGVLYSNAPM